jgi:hypothetical protein
MGNIGYLVKVPDSKVVVCSEYRTVPSALCNGVYHSQAMPSLLVGGIETEVEVGEANHGDGR